MGLWDNDGNDGGFGAGFGGDEGGASDGAGLDSDGGIVGGDADMDAGEGMDVDAVSEADADGSRDAGDERKAQGGRAAKKRSGLPKLDRAQAKRYGGLWDALQDDGGREVARQLAGVSTDDPARLFDLLSDLKLDSLPKMDGAQAKRFRELWDLLKGDEGVAVAKLLASSNSPLPEALIEALTGTKTRNAVEEWSVLLKRLHSDDVVSMQMNLVEAFTNDKKLSASMFRLFAAVGADAGRASGSPVKDAMALGAKWAEGVDLSVVDRMRV